MMLSEVEIKNYRSISKLKVKFQEKKLMVICGANNVGKTNFLRALDLFFSLDTEKFDPEGDIPHHISKGSHGAGYKTEITAVFTQDDQKVDIKAKFTRDKKKGKVVSVSGKRNGQIIQDEEIRAFLNKFRFIFIESSNTDLSQKIAEIVNDDVLLGLDRLRSRQNEPLQLLNQFIEKSKIALGDIEGDITGILKEYTKDIYGLDTTNWKTQILFPEFSRLRDAISQLVHFTLHDTNVGDIDTKGSGIQKIVILALIKYISEKSPKTVIWGIDEPEAFLQPALQKKVKSVFWELSKDIQIVISTHSNHFIDTTNLSSTYLFEGSWEEKEYIRKPGQVFYKTKTEINKKEGIEKVVAIKEYLGLERNDAWELLPFNLLVEGEEDKDYLTTLFKFYGCNAPNILVAGGTDKIKGYLQFLNEFTEDISFKAKVLCILDHDQAGKTAYAQLTSRRDRYNFDLTVTYIPRFDNLHDSEANYEIEDAIPPRLIFNSLNKLLRKRKYKIVKKKQEQNRTLQVHNKRKLLEYATELVASNNADKDRLDINTEGIKKFICKKTSLDIQDKHFDDELKSCSVLKDFICSLVENSQPGGQTT